MKIKITDSVETRKVIRVFFSLLTIKGVDLAIPLITLPYLIYTIGLENYGLVNFSIALSIYFFSFVQYGFPVSAARDVARNRNSPLKISAIFSITIYSMFILTIFASITFGLLLIFIEKFLEYKYLHIFTFLSLITKAFVPIWFFQGIQQMGNFTWINIISRLALLLLILTFIKAENDFIYLPIINLATSFFVIMLSYYIIINKYNIKFHRFKFGKVKSKIYLNFNTFIAQFAPNLYTNSATFFLGMTSTPLALGIFTSASKIIDIVGLFSHAMANATLPFITRNKTKHIKVLSLMIISGVFLSVVVAIMSGFLTKILFPENASDVRHILILMLPILPLLFFNLALGNNFLLIFGYEKEMRNIVLNCSIFSLVYSIPLIYMFGLYGSVFTLVFTRLVIAVFYYFSYRLKVLT
ncbi:oligosaccharide flippase family protein [Idiomarina sp. PL1-037]|uniref:oligosaccharide flippase family protein n=1 Tax=Idiomarina sp. PL1-037 TaxID=3095365 RepID=UPI002ACC2512|nr:oligosaccharide flippase family protein [Idiomarina sp. PL1-037]WQC53498.1 oligosaccharide flippase family protein [Idiomarina sp. PL1-037]